MFFSIIIPFYNKISTIEACLNSVFAQNYVDFEIIIVDDFSEISNSTNLIQIVNNFKIKYGDKLTLFRNSTNSGPGYSRNIGIDLSKGDILIFLDADDEFTLSYLINLNKVFITNHSSIVISSTIELSNGLIRPNFNNLSNNRFIQLLEGNLYKTNDFIAAFCKDPIFCGCGNVAIKKSKIYNFRFNEIDRNYEDWLFFYQVCFANQENIIFMSNQQGIIYNDQISNSLSRQSVLLTNVKIPAFLFNDMVDYRFRRYVYFNWLYSTIKRISNFRDRLYVFTNHLYLQFFNPYPIWKFLLPAFLLVLKFDLLISHISRLRKLLSYDYK